MSQNIAIASVALMK